MPDRSGAASARACAVTESLLEYLDCRLRERLSVLPAAARRRAAGGGRAPAAGGLGRTRANAPGDPAAAGDERARLRAEALAGGPRALGQRGEAGSYSRAPGTARGRAARAPDRRAARLPRALPREPEARRYVHYLFNVPALLPIGDFLVHAQEWTGRSPAELLGLLRGASPDPLGAADELARLVVALRRDRGATATTRDSGREPAEVLATLRWLPGEAGALAAAYVDRVGYRPVNGEDVGEPERASSSPSLIVEAMRPRSTPPPAARRPTSLEEPHRARCGEVVPSAHRDEFDELLGEARAVYAASRRARKLRSASGRSESCGGRSWRRSAAGRRRADRAARASGRGRLRRDPRDSSPRARGPRRRNWRRGPATGSEATLSRRAAPARAASLRRRCRPSGYRPRPRGSSGRSARWSRRCCLAPEPQTEERQGARRRRQPGRV